MSDEKPMVSPEEHDQGWKDLPVVLKGGKHAVWRIAAVDSRKAQVAYAAMFDGEPDALHKLALGPEHMAQIGKLTLESLADVQKSTAILAFGEGFQKKMELQALALAAAMFGTSSPLNSGSSAAATTPANSAPGASPGSGSTSANLNVN